MPSCQLEADAMLGQQGGLLERVRPPFLVVGQLKSPADDGEPPPRRTYTMHANPELLPLVATRSVAHRVVWSLCFFWNLCCFSYFLLAFHSGTRRLPRP
jgi:hypothetical protein